MATTDSVLHIVQAFTRSLDILRERRRKKKSAKLGRGKAGAADSSGDELVLSKSLRQGPVDIQREYEKHYKVKGDRYAIGDSTARDSLARIIRKLNTGLVNIISSFLSCDRKDVQLDYKYLTSLSDSSRREALDTLSQLSVRLSQSALSLHPQPACPRQNRKECVSRDSKSPVKGRKRSNSKDVKGHKRSGSKDGKVKEPVVRMVHLSNSSNPQLAIVRPRTRRKGSSTSSRSEYTSSTSSPPPAYSATHSPPPQPVAYQPSPARHQPHHHTTSPPASPSYLTPHSSPVYSRRREKPTPSMHTFASDSTKLGEISMNRWNIPYDYEAMARKNQEVPLRPWTSEEPAVKAKRGFWGMFKKSGVAA